MINRQYTRWPENTDSKLIIVDIPVWICITELSRGRVNSSIFCSSRASSLARRPVMSVGPWSCCPWSMLLTMSFIFLFFPSTTDFMLCSISFLFPFLHKSTWKLFKSLSNHENFSILSIISKFKEHVTWKSSTKQYSLSNGRILFYHYIEFVSYRFTSIEF